MLGFIRIFYQVFDVVKTAYLSSVLFYLYCLFNLFFIFIFYLGHVTATGGAGMICSRLFRLKHLLSGTVKVSPKEPQKTSLEL